MKIKNVAEFDAALANGAYDYDAQEPIYFIFADGEPVSFIEAEQDAPIIREAIANNGPDALRVVSDSRGAP